MVLRWKKLTDARGHKHRLSPIRKAMKQSGLSRNAIVQPGETPSLIEAIWYTGVLYLIGLLTAYGYVELVGGDGYQLLLTGKTRWWVLLGGALYIFFIAWYVHLFRWQNAESVVTALTRTGLCPSCAYNMEGVVLEHDGCTVCPECGAAWRLSP